MKELKDVIKELNKKHGNTIITNGKKTPLKPIPTGSYILDSKTGISGYPVGKIVEIAGGEAAGKTTLAIEAMISAQNKFKSKKVVFVDMEHALDLELAKSIGLDIKKLIYVAPQGAEEALDTIVELIRTDSVSLIVLDSVASMVSGAEMEDSLGDAKMGILARLMSKALKKIGPLADKHETTIILLNQLREKIGGYKSAYGDTREAAGGNAIKFYTSLRIFLTKGKAFINEDDKIIGHKIRFKIKKNKCGMPNGNGEIPLIYTEGVSKIDEMIEIARALGVISTKGAFYYYNVSDKESQKIGQGIVKTRNFFLENKEAFEQLEKACKDELDLLKKNRLKINKEGYKEK